MNKKIKDEELDDSLEVKQDDFALEDDLELDVDGRYGFRSNLEGYDFEDDSGFSASLPIFKAAKNVPYLLEFKRGVPRSLSEKNGWVVMFEVDLLKKGKKPISYSLVGGYSILSALVENYTKATGKSYDPASFKLKETIIKMLADKDFVKVYENKTFIYIFNGKQQTKSGQQYNSITIKRVILKD